MGDEALHDFQLNGKQLVFLFMAGTIVAVVIFLCGVMVGRGVRVSRPGEQAPIAAESDVDPTVSAQAPLAITSSAGGTPTASQETLSYTDRLEAPDPAAERLQDPVPPADTTSVRSRSADQPSPSGSASAAAPTRTTGAAPATTAGPAPAPVTPAAVSPTASAVPEAVEPAGPGFVVQVAATRERTEADSIVRRLTGKGYPAFVTSPTSGPRMFRVRVGKYAERREAESVASRLEKEEQFKPWITR